MKTRILAAKCPICGHECKVRIWDEWPNKPVGVTTCLHYQGTTGQSRFIFVVGVACSNEEEVLHE